MEIFSGIQYMRALTLIYSHRVPGFQETPAGFDPKQKRNLNPKRKAKTRLSVDRLVDRLKLRAACFQSVDRAVDRSMPRSTGRSTELVLCTLCTPIDRAVDRAVDRPSPPADRAVDQELAQPASMHRLTPLSSDLCATFFHLLYLLSPYKLMFTVSGSCKY